MKNMFKLFYLYFILSISFNKECLKEECGSFDIEGENEEYYICSPSDEDNCIWKLLCNYITISNSDIKYSEQPVSDSNKFTCIQEGNFCIEILYCENVIFSSEEEYEIDCSIYPLKDGVDKEKKYALKMN